MRLMGVRLLRTSGLVIPDYQLSLYKIRTQRGLTFSKNQVQKFQPTIIR
jgi:hypothetical protein